MNVCYFLRCLASWNLMVQELYIQFVNVNGIHTPCVKELVGVFEEIHTGSDGKESTCNAGDLGSVLGLGRSPGKGNGNPLQYSCLENSMDGGAWPATVHGLAKSRTRLSD